MMSVADFLGVDPHVYATVLPAVRHAGAYEEPMERRAFRLLKETFQFEIRQLEKMLSWDLAEWLEPAGL